MRHAERDDSEPGHYERGHLPNLGGGPSWSTGFSRLKPVLQLRPVPNLPDLLPLELVLFRDCTGFDLPDPLASFLRFFVQQLIDLPLLLFADIGQIFFHRQLSFTSCAALLLRKSLRCNTGIPIASMM